MLAKALLLWTATAVRGASPAATVPFETDLPRTAPAAWQLDVSNPPAPDETVHVTLALRQEGVPQLLADLHAQSDPASSRYGAHWTAAQARHRVHAPAAAHARVLEWLRAAGAIVASSTPDRSLVDAALSVAAAERAFGPGLTLARYVHAGGAWCIRARPGQRYRLPAAIAPFVDVVDGLVRFPPAKRSGWSPSAGTGARVGPAFNVTPASLRARYGATAAARPPSSASNTQSVVSFLGQYFSPDDLATFQKQNDLADAPIAGVYPAAAPQNASHPGIEAELDVQFLAGVANGTRTVVWSTGGERPGGNEPFLTWLGAVAKYAATGAPLPSVFSISYQDYEDTVSESFMARVSVEFAKLGAQGVTLVTGSGDWGVGCTAAAPFRFRPDFPSSSPYIVSTGATTLDGAGGTADAEIGVTFSSGGFSDFFAQPPYQRAAVARFLAQQSKAPTTAFNASGRAFPDVAALGVNFRVVYKGDTMSVGGTSAATPTFAAVVTMLNDARLAAGKPTMGWILPFLYDAAAARPGAGAGAAGAAFTDVVSGNNAFGNCSGFDCAVGWDPMTGLGTPNVPALVQHALAVVR